MAKTKKQQALSTSDIIATIPARLKKFLAMRYVKSFFEHKWPLALLTSLFIAMFVSPHLNFLSKQFHTGEYAERTIKATRTLYVEDIKSTREREEEAAEASPPVFEYDSTLASRQKEQVAKAFERMRTFLGAGKEEATPGGIPQARLISRKEMAKAEEAFASGLNVTGLDKSDFTFLARSGYPQSVLENIDRTIDAAAGRKIVAEIGAFDALFANKPLNSRSIFLRDIATGKESTLSKIETVIDTDLFQKEAKANLKQSNPREHRADLIGLQIAMGVLGPNLKLNAAETDKLRLSARTAVVPSMVKYAKNQVIVGEGEKITRDKLAVLNQMANAGSRGNQILAFLSASALCFLILTVLFRFGEKNIRKFTLTTRDLLFVGFMSILTTFMIRLGVTIATAVSESLEFVPQSALMYALPIAASAMVLRIVLNSEITIFYALLLSVFSGLLVGGDNAFTIVVLIGSFAGTSMMRHVTRRLQILRAGLYMGLLNAAAVLCLGGFSGIKEDILTTEMLFNLGGALIGGILSGPLVMAILPIMEGLFGYTSNITLLELASLNHPLLKEMVLRAPGTYNHCVLVSSLAEAGGEVIHANPLLAKVAGLYHDVGKVNKPLYFSENLSGGEDPHDNLYPSMSTLILTAHVREGVELARKYGLGDRICDIIRQHHGTSLIRSFYDRAKTLEDPTRSPVQESDFRYPGPKPHSREAALVMLANVLEASSGKLPNPTSTRLEQHIESVIHEIFLDGQLSECDLTLQDLQNVSKAFLKVIVSFYHSRIEYPAEPQKKPNGERILTLVNGSHSE